MRVETMRGLFGETIPGTQTVRLTVRERATLAGAARILHAVRALRDDADDDLTTDIALAAYVCDELAERARGDVP